MHDAVELADEVQEFLLREYSRGEGPPSGTFESNPSWQKLRELGTDLWLDTGSVAESSPLWCKEFSALTTNNTLLNNEVQAGQYDELVAEARELLDPFDLTDAELRLEIAFILNVAHGLRLVGEYGAVVSVEGTPCYMSPEQIRGEAVDERTDVYSLALVLYECLAGRPAFAHNTDMKGVLSEEAPYLTEAPPAVADVIARAIQKDREDRWSSIREFHAELVRAAPPVPA